MVPYRSAVSDMSVVNMLQNTPNNTHTCACPHTHTSVTTSLPLHKHTRTHTNSVTTFLSLHTHIRICASAYWHKGKPGLLIKVSYSSKCSVKLINGHELKDFALLVHANLPLQPEGCFLESKVMYTSTAEMLKHNHTTDRIIQNQYLTSLRTSTFLLLTFFFPRGG